ncbi:MAG TPA: pyridoxal phosphate-dependent aminotransferase [Stellaceae bacterium]|jgi:aspartate/methionine/tyrosine aminotransferase|nr:pyridoxal phosphate-dependent aminotransferase [Stellaceae bacterium]
MSLARDLLPHDLLPPPEVPVVHDYLSMRPPGMARFDLSGSESEPVNLQTLLSLARPEDLARWHGLRLGYPDPRGSNWLRRTIAGRYAGLGPEDILVTAGAQEGLSCIAQALLTPEDHAVVILPIYSPAERAVTDRCPSTGVALQKQARGWYLDIAAVEAAIKPSTRLVLTNFPNSPTGAVIGHDDLAALIELCRRHRIWLVNDEVYRLTANRPDRIAAPVVDLYEQGISIDAVSKGLGLPGLRVGWIACRDAHVRQAAMAAKGQLSACPGAPSEVLAQIALGAEAEIVHRNRRLGAAHRRHLLAFIDRHGDLFEPAGTDNLAFAFIRYLGRDGVAALTERLARELGLLLLPSTLWRSRLGFDDSRHIRIGLGKRGVTPALDVWQVFLDRR